jgi:two-component system, NtrC family, sensor histidine kinase HydH
LGGDQNRFAGVAYPTGPAGPQGAPQRNEPPPLEMPYIRVQALQCLHEGKVVTNLRTVERSQVVILTEPVHSEGDNPVATWVMFRLAGPEQLETQVRRYQISTGLALGGIALALFLTVNLGRSLTRQRLEQEQLREELRHSEHLAALGKLLAGVAHEVRNPLAGIRSTVQLWKRLPDSARTDDSLDAVVHAVDRLNDIVSKLLYFSRSDNAVRKTVSFNPVIMETVKLLEAQAADQHVRFEAVIDPDLPMILGSASALRQVILNLLTNALQAMPGGGQIRCVTQVNADGQSVEVVIADTGTGISPEDRKHLFEPFYTTRPEGTGLGLALCREIVVQHGGRIEWAPTAGPGATFRLSFPIVGGWG